MREGQVYRWNGRQLTRDRAYERRVAKVAAGAYRQLRIHPEGNVRL